ncbi:MAG: MBL fold metallo-hydrolase [Pyrinomonadaceae bacterium]
MKIKTFVQTAFQQNTRIVSCDETRKALCIDPGEPSPEVAEYIAENKLELKAVVLTHGHLDHVGGTAFIHEKFPDAEILVHKDEEPLYFALPMQPLAMGMPPHQLRALGLEYSDPPKPTRNPEHGETLEIGKLKFEFRHCPGHTLGHVVLVEHNERCVFTGDCLFSRTIGRTDLPGGNHAQLIDSINANLLSLDDDFIAFCGHGEDTTIGEERRSNPFLTGIYN